jgi:hypothetical protein
MDPATIGLLISIVPTVLDLLFGRGSDIKHGTILKNPTKMYGYGLEGYGYRYPTLPEQYVRLPYQTSYGVIEKAVRVPSKKWAATYFLNQRTAANNKWVNFLRKKMDKLREEYYKEELKQEKIPEKVKRMRHKLMAEAIRRMSELDALEHLPDEELIKLYYEGTVPRSKTQKQKLYKLLPATQVLVPPEQQVLVPVAKK